MTIQEQLEKAEKKLAEQILISDWLYQRFNEATSLMEDLETQVRNLKRQIEQPGRNPFDDDDDGEPEDIPF